MMAATQDEIAAEEKTAVNTRDWPFYIAAVLSGILAGVVHVAVEDPLLTALVVVIVTMVLGFMRPSRPWRWVLLVGVMVPLVMFTANLLQYYRTLTRAGMYGSVLIVLPGLAGAFGGMFGRRFMEEMFFKKQ